MLENFKSGQISSEQALRALEEGRGEPRQSEVRQLSDDEVLEQGL